MTANKSPITQKTSSDLTPGRGAPLTPFDEMDRLFDAFFPANWSRLTRMGWPRWAEAMPRLQEKLPSVDMIERDAQVIVRAEMPGLNKDDIEISINGNVLTIRGNSRREETKEEGEYYRKEIYQGEISRSLTLPAEVDGDNAKAIFKEGVLELTIPKTSSSKRRSIKVE